MSMLDILKKFDAVEKKSITECGDMSGPMTTINITASTQDMANILKALSNIESGEMSPAPAMEPAMQLPVPVETEETMDEWSNEPDESVQDTEFMTKDLSGGINKEKKMYARAQPGDNAMAVESIKERLYKALAEAKDKKDQDGDGDNDFADVMIARMEKSGMSKKQAIAKTKDKPYNKNKK